ncbi:thiopurine S-methyltransferase [Pusillimonas sp. CC-YST705]|uniref:Thiopurine S-methyltransferase n=1 Tax=Mesopusillimonas faecipullorum TaxID=2755040 RepID=A0ABS8C9Y8_9BURK|nr:thiopurine S-methyltransferase [Mesopusillimonas faecipullorum]MCB5362657.1 thiopurine S-methyltransferase [Mesopusillimonas faecipullorum]
MDADFWLQRWQQGRTGFHQDRIEPMLARHWPTLGVAPGSTVLVPLCGKALDLIWLAEQGLQVMGVELSPLAAQQFFAEQGMQATQELTDYGVWWRHGQISILCADIFQVPATLIASCSACYDRAALVALPEPMRSRYAKAVYGPLPAASKSLLITVDYPQHERAGPPFAVSGDEVNTLFDPSWMQVQQLEKRDILAKEPKFLEQGVTRFETSTYALTRLPNA